MPNQSEPLPQDASLRLFDPAGHKLVSVAGAKLTVPSSGSFANWPPPDAPCYGSTAEGTPSLVLWSTTDTYFAGNGVASYDGLWGMRLGSGEPVELVPADTLVLAHFRSGDVLVLPLSSAEYENRNQGKPGGSLGKRLALLAGSTGKAVEVDPKAPRLSRAQLEPISPDLCFFRYAREDDLLRTDLPGKPPRVFDLHTGKSVDIRVEDPQLPREVTQVRVAGRWAAWGALEGNPAPVSYFLVDLDKKEARRIHSEATGSGRPSWGGLVLSSNWLLGFETPSGDLVGLHLPDRTSIRIPGVFKEGERAFRLQAMDDVALVEIRYSGPAINLPERVLAVRLVRLRQVWSQLLR